jgi:hypothetical protein
MSWTPIGIDGVFFISLATILVGAFGVSVKYCLKSKCEHFSFCYGLLHIDRRVDLETQVDMRALELGITDNDDLSHTTAERRPSLTPVN